MNVVLVFYTLWGYLSPIDFFWHPGTTFYRVITSSTVELSTGIYGQYAQIALTTIAAFLLLAAAARGFDAQGAMVQFMQRIAGKSRATIPQTAVLASSAVGMISGSGAANATVVGAFTIPLMKRYGVPGEFAAAVETSASMGGLIMPPVMAVGRLRDGGIPRRALLGCSAPRLFPGLRLLLHALPVRLSLKRAADAPRPDRES